MASIVVSGDTSGAITLQAPSVSGNTTLNLPASSGTVLTQNSSAPANSFVVDASGNVGVGTSSPQANLDVSGTGAKEIRITSNTSGNARIGFNVAGSVYAYWEADRASGAMIYSNGTERMRIDSNGDVLINTTSQATNYGGRMNLWGNYTAQWGLSMNSTSGTGTQYYIAFIRNNSGSAAGTISSTATNSTTYATTSDYRLKENVTPMTGALDKVALLNPVTYTWKEDGSSGQGFIAHELQSVIPECVVGEKDEVREDGTPVYQGVDTSFLVATLTKAIQELKAIVDEQAEKIKALEAK